MNYIDDIKSEIARLRRVINETQEDSKEEHGRVFPSEQALIGSVQSQIRVLEGYVEKFKALEKECDGCIERFPH